MNRLLLMWAIFCMARFTQAADMDLSQAIVVTRGDRATAVEQTAATVLVEEIEKRTGIHLKIAEKLADGVPAIIVTASLSEPSFGNATPPASMRDDVSRLRAEGYCVYSDESSGRTVLWIVGTDPRGTLYGVGHLLRKLTLQPGSIKSTSVFDVSTSPEYALRGHQLGYRDRANSYDAWDERQYDQYIRELALFGANAVENIPFEDAAPLPHARLGRREMNLKISQICQRYGMEHWVWVPADFNLTDTAKRSRSLQDQEQFYAACARLDGVFFPGGDPGDNPPELVMPFLQELAARFQPKHATAKIWLSMQGFDPTEVNFVYSWLEKNQPEWLGGLVHGPSSPDLAETRRRLPVRYGIRHYPDLTHCVRCQYPIPWWDPAFSCTLGREPINPTPTYQKQIHNAFAPWTNGFLSYSDGCHDDVNKVIWTQLAWAPNADVREILIDYARFFFGANIAEQAADGILALERNWEGPVHSNGGINATLAFWQELEQEHEKSLRGNWRWEMCLLRTYYDADVRQRQIFESGLEDQVNLVLANAGKHGANATMVKAQDILQLADTDRPHSKLRGRIVELCESLFQTIGLQTSVEKYRASGSERGAVLDFIDYPLNNRWWLEDQFAEIRKLPAEQDKLARLDLIRNWENPGPGSTYDDVGHVGKSPHVIRGETPDTDPKMRRNPNPDYWEAGLKRSRQSWYSKMDWPIGMRYDGLDPNVQYTVRTTGFAQCLLSIDGERVTPTLDGKDVGEFKEFPVPQQLLSDGKLLLTFDVPDETHLNWRQQSRLTELWLLKSVPSDGKR